MRWHRVAIRSVSIVLLCQAAFGAAGASASDEEIQKRLADAQKLAQTARETLSPIEKELVFLADFEQDGLLFLGRDGSFSVTMDKTHYRPGKFGRGFFFEKPRQNMLPPAMADVETDIGGFQAQGKTRLASADADTAFGRKVLSAIMPAEKDGFQTAPVKVASRRLAEHEKEWTLLASVYVKGTKDAQIRVQAAFVPKAIEAPAAEKKKVAYDPMPDKTPPQAVKLTGEWQRIACTASSDRRANMREREASLSIASLGPGEIALLADGFQFEQCGYYPHNHDMPTTWIAGGESAKETSVRIGAPLAKSFPVDEGTFAFWTCTPRESNLANQGAVFWSAFACGWTGAWSLSTYRCSAGGEGFMYASILKVLDGKWHHVAMTWDDAKGYLYKDGAQVGTFEHKRQGRPTEIERYALTLGGGYGQTASSVMDDVALFKRKLSDDELRRIAEAATPLRATVEPLAFTQPVRTVFYRDEAECRLEMKAVALAALKGPLTVDAAVGEQVFASQAAKIEDGVAEISIPFAAGTLKCGKYACRIGALADGKAAYMEFPIEIVPAVRFDHYLMCLWGEGADTAERLAYLKVLGLNAVDTYGTNFDELGRNGFRYCWHYNFGNGVWSPKNREAVRKQTQEAARLRAPYPNWRHTLLNSEVGTHLPDAENRKEWFDAWAEKELGFPIPATGWKLGSPHNPVSCSFPEGKKPGKDGLYKNSQEMAFLKWWYNRGCGWWRLNAEAAAEIRKLRPEVVCWTDPLGYPGQIADLGAGSTWSYQIWPHDLVGEFEQSYACARGSGKEYYATLGMDYVTGLTGKVTEPDGKPKNLVPTADDMIQQAWLAVTQIPTDGITYWDCYGAFLGLKGANNRYADPGCDAKLGAVLKGDLLPIGTMLKGVPNGPRPLALLLPESTLWMCAGEGGQWWGVVHYTNHWKKWVGKLAVPYDVVLDHNVTPGSLAKYKAIVFPMAQYVSETVHNELVAAGKSGTRIIVDSYCSQEYPNMERWEQKYRLPPSVWKEPSYNEAAEKPLAELVAKLVPEMDAHAKGAQARTFYNLREVGGVKYVSVVNDNRQEGPYTQWTKNPNFKPYGKEQEATVRIKAAPGSVAYEFTESRRLEAKADGDRLTVTVSLPPHAGRLVCVYPRELKQVRIEADAASKRGRPGAIKVSILDDQEKPAPGRQLVQVTIADPEGKEHDESGLYRMENGAAQVPFRPARNDAAGEWKVTVVERTSGLKQTAAFKVE